MSERYYNWVKARCELSGERGSEAHGRLVESMDDHGLLKWTAS